jgi:cobalamin biosynthetic protein CobC
MDERLRALVAPFAVHGGRSDLARAQFGGEDWLDLSTGISPWAYPFVIPDEALARLPSPDDLALLEARAAACFGSDPARTVAVPGSDIGLRLIGHHLASARAAAVVPGYGGHGAMWPGEVQAVTSTMPALMAAAQDCDAIVLARPGNPGGEVVAEDLLDALAKQLAKRGGWLIVDEAFADADPATSLAGKHWPNLIILRSFGKFAGLAGLRLGFVIGPSVIVNRLRAVLGDWPISGPALAAGIAFYADTAWQTEQRRRLKRHGDALGTVLQSARLAITASTPFFCTCKIDGAWGLFEHLACRAILIRPFADDPRRLRIGLPADDNVLKRLAEALAEWSPS